MRGPCLVHQARSHTTCMPATTRSTNEESITSKLDAGRTRAAIADRSNPHKKGAVTRTNKDTNTADPTTRRTLYVLTARRSPIGNALLGSSLVELARVVNFSTAEHT